MNTMRAFLNAAAYVVVILVNYLSNALPINGQTAAQISDRLNVLYTPAGYVFSIWGLIYVLLGWWIIHQLLPKNRSQLVYQRIQYWFVISCVLNASWLLFFHYERFNFTLVVMIALLLSLIRIYRAIQRSSPVSFITRLPFSIYLGWVSVATIVNVAIVLQTSDWSGWGVSAVAWTVIMLGAGTILAVWFAVANRDMLYPLVFIWAFIGISIEQSGYEQIVRTAWLMAGVLLVFVAMNTIQQFKKFRLHAE